MLGLWTPTRSLPKNLECLAIPGDGRRVGPGWTLIQIVYRLVRKLGCVKSYVLVKNSRQLISKEHFRSGWLAPRVI